MFSKFGTVTLVLNTGQYLEANFVLISVNEIFARVP